MKVSSMLDDGGCIFVLALGLSASTMAAPLPLTGVNIAGGEFWWSGRATAHPQYGLNYSYPTKAEIEYFAAQGMNVFRYAFRWETLQPTVRTPLDQPDLARLKESVKWATSRKLVVLLDPHNYARYGTNIVGGAIVSGADFADFWQRLAVEFKADPYVWFGLVNEPHHLPTQQWFDAANACIAAIRDSGSKNLILVPGNRWTGAQSWTNGGDQSSAKCVLSVKDPLDYWVVEVHMYLDSDSSGTKKSVVSPTIGAERLKQFVKWCRQHKMRAVLGEFGVPVVPEGEETLHNTLKSMEADSDVWLGWTWWAAGARWNKQYMFDIEPRNGQDRPQMAWLQPHLYGAKMPQFTIAVKNGTGQGEAEAGALQTIQAGPAPAGMVFRKWTGDIAWLTDANSPNTMVCVPFKNIAVEAFFEKAP